MFGFSGKLPSCSEAARGPRPVGSVHAASLGTRLPPWLRARSPPARHSPRKASGSWGWCLAWGTRTHGVWPRPGACRALGVSAGAAVWGFVGHEPSVCPGCQEGQWDPGVHQEECGQQVEGGSPPPLHCPGEAPSAVLCSVLGSPVQER